jgi:hypothetical protein
LGGVRPRKRSQIVAGPSTIQPAPPGIAAPFFPQRLDDQDVVARANRSPTVRPRRRF